MFDMFLIFCDLCILFLMQWVFFEFVLLRDIVPKQYKPVWGNMFCYADWCFVLGKVCIA